MSEYIRVTAKTVEDAVLEASIQLGTTSENIEYNVIEHETKGFLGIGAKKAVIEAKIIRQDEDIISEVFSDKKSTRSKVKKADRPKKNEKNEKSEKKDKKEKKDRDTKKDSDKEDRGEKKERKEKKEKKAPVKKNAETSEKNEHHREKMPRVPADPEEAKRRAEQFLNDTFRAMGLTVETEISFENDTLSAELSGDDMGMLIGKRGQTLDALQYLTSLVVNKGNASYVRVKIDTENYRERRRATLENLARNIAFKVKKTKRSVYLEPMNPYERRIIHSALQADPYVTTHSEGEEPLRKVVVTLKKRNFDESAYADEFEGYADEVKEEADGAAEAPAMQETADMPEAPDALDAQEADAGEGTDAANEPVQIQTDDEQEQS